MLTVKRIKLSDYRLHEIGQFDTITELVDHFINLYGTRYLYDRFSFNPYSKFRNSYWESYREGGLTKKYRLIPAEYKYIIENEKGIRFSEETLKGIFCPHIKQSWYYSTGYKRHHRGSYYRRVRTMQERRTACLILKEEFEPSWRGKRGFSLSHFWDDIRHFDDYNRNWKRYRKTQWK